MPPSPQPSSSKSPSFLKRIKRIFKWCLKKSRDTTPGTARKSDAKAIKDRKLRNGIRSMHNLKRLPRVKPDYSDPTMRTGLLGPKGIPLGYLNMPKSGCSTIKNILYYLERGNWLPDPLQIHLVVSRGKGLLLYQHFQRQRMELEPASPYFVFTFVRHPGRRVYSAFVEKILTIHEYSFAGIQNHLIDNTVFLHQGKRIGSLSEMPALEAMELDDLRHNFREFLKFVKANLDLQTRFPANAHWALQSARLDSLEEHDKVHFVGKMESFVADFEHVLGQIGIRRPDLARMRFNEGPKPPFRFEDVVDDDLRSKIRMIYAPDFDRFGYQDD